MDLDETVLDNTRCWCATWNSAMTTQWDTRATGKNRKTRPDPRREGVFEHVNQSKVRIYYVSDRMQENKANTINTLKSLGLPQVSDDSVLLDTVSKEERRHSILKSSRSLCCLATACRSSPCSLKQKPSEQQRELVEASANILAMTGLCCLMPLMAHGLKPRRTAGSRNNLPAGHGITVGQPKLSIPFIGPITFERVLKF